LSAPENPEAEKPAASQEQEKREAAVIPPAPIDRPTPQQAQAAEEQKKPTVEELLALMQAQLIAFQAENKKSIDLIASENKKSIELMASAIVKLNEKIEAKPAKGEGTSEWIEVLKDLAGAGKPSSLEEAAKSVGGLVKFAEEMDRFRHPFDFEGALAKRLLWRQGMRVGGIPRYMTKLEMKRYDKLLDTAFGLEEEEGEEEHVK